MKVVGPRSCEDLSAYDALASSGDAFCQDVSSYEGTSEGLQDCKAKCDRDGGCKFFSIWMTGGQHWCRLTASCVALSHQPGHSIGVYKRHQMALPGSPFEVSQPLALPFVDIGAYKGVNGTSCDAYPACRAAGLAGRCCPNHEKVTLSCCNGPPPALPGHEVKPVVPRRDPPSNWIQYDAYPPQCDITVSWPLSTFGVVTGAVEIIVSHEQLGPLRCCLPCTEFVLPVQRFQGRIARIPGIVTFIDEFVQSMKEADFSLQAYTSHFATPPGVFASLAYEVLLEMMQALLVAASTVTATVAARPGSMPCSSDVSAAAAGQASPQTMKAAVNFSALLAKCRSGSELANIALRAAWQSDPEGMRHRLLSTELGTDLVHPSGSGAQDTVGVISPISGRVQPDNDARPTGGLIRSHIKDFERCLAREVYLAIAIVAFVACVCSKHSLWMTADGSAIFRAAMRMGYSDPVIHQLRDFDGTLPSDNWLFSLPCLLQPARGKALEAQMEELTGVFHSVNFQWWTEMRLLVCWAATPLVAVALVLLLDPNIENRQDATMSKSNGFVNGKSVLQTALGPMRQGLYMSSRSELLACITEFCTQAYFFGWEDTKRLWEVDVSEQLVEMYNT
ncbi:unnamed protein product, partial [Symbiodinium sp. KB8]